MSLALRGIHVAGTAWRDWFLPLHDWFMSLALRCMEQLDIQNPSKQLNFKTFPSFPFHRAAAAARSRGWPVPACGLHVDCDVDYMLKAEAATC